MQLCNNILYESEVKCTRIACVCVFLYVYEIHMYSLLVDTRIQLHIIRAHTHFTAIPLGLFMCVHIRIHIYTWSMYITYTVSLVCRDNVVVVVVGQQVHTHTHILIYTCIHLILSCDDGHQPLTRCAHCCDYNTHCERGINILYIMCSRSWVRMVGAGGWMRG